MHDSVSLPTVQPVRHRGNSRFLVVPSAIWTCNAWHANGLQCLVCMRVCVCLCQCASVPVRVRVCVTHLGLQEGVGSNTPSCTDLQKRTGSSFFLAQGLSLPLSPLAPCWPVCFGTKAESMGEFSSHVFPHTVGRYPSMMKIGAIVFQSWRWEERIISPRHDSDAGSEHLRRNYKRGVREGVRDRLGRPVRERRDRLGRRAAGRALTSHHALPGRLDGLALGARPASRRCRTQ